VASPELSVVCKSCGSEVSPYVTECPYCGTRLRRRAPKLERQGDELRARESRRDRRRRLAAERSDRESSFTAFTAERPYVTIAAILGPTILLIVQRAADLTAYRTGAIIGPVDSEWWRYFASPFVFDDIGYLFTICLALAIFLPRLEERLGMVPTLLLVVACGALGMLAVDGVESAVGDSIPIAAGGNGIALGVVGTWFGMRFSDVRDDPTDTYDPLAIAVAAGVLMALPLIEDFASVWAGVAGGLVGLGAGFSAARGRRS
jgi:membrane associated rhomboid family serine protease